MVRDIYVDVTSNVHSVKEGCRFYKFAKQAMSAAVFELQEWYSNSKELKQLMNCSLDDVELKV